MVIVYVDCFPQVVAANLTNRLFCKRFTHPFARSLARPPPRPACSRSSILRNEKKQKVNFKERNRLPLELQQSDGRRGDFQLLEKTWGFSKKINRIYLSKL